MTGRAWLMNIDQLRAFLTVADEMSISGAADRMGTTQPVISRTIKRLEAELHASLFDRLPRGVALTPYGNVLYAEAQSMLASHRRTVEAIDALRGIGRTRVRIGAGATWFEERLPGILSSFSSAHPRVRIDAEFVPRFEVIEALLLGRIDIGLAQFGMELLPSDDIEYEELLRDRLVVLGRRGHPLTGALTTTKAFRSLVWAITPSASGEDRLRGLCKRFGVDDPNIHVRCHSTSSLLGIVRETDFVTLAPEFMARTRGKGDFDVLTDEFRITLSKGILTPRRGTLSLGARLFRAHLREAFRVSEEQQEHGRGAKDVAGNVSQQ